MKIYVPSHKRPNSKLFEITHGLNIILQFKEDVEPYSKWKGRHNVIYLPELRGLLDARNWILENNDDWVLMLDDDIVEFTENSEIIEWDKFLEKTESSISQIDISKVGIAGLNIYPDEYGLDMGPYIIGEGLRIFQVVFLNCKLLKIAGYRYEGCPYDGFNGQRAYGEDWDILYYCYNNNIQSAKFNSLCFETDRESPTVCWENDKEIWVLLSQLWLLEKYKYSRVIGSILYDINRALRKCRNQYKEKLYDNIMKKISYGVLNKDEGDTEMKKFLIGGLVLSLLLGVGCKHDPDPEPEKVVDAKHRGEYWTTPSNNRVYKLIIKESEIIFNDGFSVETDIDISSLPSYPAWIETSENGSIQLWYTNTDTSITQSLGYFLDDNSFESIYYEGHEKRIYYRKE